MRAPRGATAQAASDVEMNQIFMPALSSTMTEGKISEWLMGVGDKVAVGDMVPSPTLTPSPLVPLLRLP